MTSSSSILSNRGHNTTVELFSLQNTQIVKLSFKKKKIRENKNKTKNNEVWIKDQIQNN